MSAQRVINNTQQPISLSGGVQLAAAGTKGSEREVVVNERIRRLAERGLVSIHPSPGAEAAVPESPGPAPVGAQAEGQKRSTK